MLAEAPELSIELIISRLRQRSIGEIIDRAFHLYRSHFLTFLAIPVVAYVPVHIASQAIDGAIAVARPDVQGRGVFGSTLLSRQRRDGPTHSNKPRKANIRHKAGKVGRGQ